MQRVAIVGIDGSGKTTTAAKLVRRLSDAMSVCKPGRPPLVAAPEQPDSFMAEQAAALEERLRAADATGSRLRIMLSRRRYLRFVTRVEQLMAGRFTPDLMLLTRCAWIDPAVYARFYLPRLSRLVSLERRLRLAALFSRVPPRQLYLHLDTPPEVAMARIDQRLDDLNASAESGREHWPHLHEQLDILRTLSADMGRALEIVAARTGARVVHIDNAEMRQDGVVELMAEQVFGLVKPRALPPARRDSAERRLGPLEVGGGRRVMVMITSSAELRYLVARPPSPDEFRGPYPLDAGPVQSMAAAAGLTLQGDEQQDVWQLYGARAERGGEVRFARFDGHENESRWQIDLESPGLLSTGTLVRGAMPAAAWARGPAGQFLCLVAYAEPSRTQVWGLIIDHQARVVRPPFCIASADEDRLLSGGHGQGDIRVSWQEGAAHFTVTWAAYRAGETVPHTEQSAEVKISAGPAPRPR